MKILLFFLAMVFLAGAGSIGTNNDDTETHDEHHIVKRQADLLTLLQILIPLFLGPSGIGSSFFPGTNGLFSGLGGSGLGGLGGLPGLGGGGGFGLGNAFGLGSLFSGLAAPKPKPASIFSGTNSIFGPTGSGPNGGILPAFGNNGVFGGSDPFFTGNRAQRPSGGGGLFNGLLGGLFKNAFTAKRKEPKQENLITAGPEDFPDEDDEVEIPYRFDNTVRRTQPRFAMTKSLPAFLQSTDSQPSSASFFSLAETVEPLLINRETGLPDLAKLQQLCQLFDTIDRAGRLDSRIRAVLTRPENMNLYLKIMDASSSGYCQYLKSTRPADRERNRHILQPQPQYSPPRRPFDRQEIAPQPQYSPPRRQFDGQEIVPQPQYFSPRRQFNGQEIVPTANSQPQRSFTSRPTKDPGSIFLQSFFQGMVES